jgi:microcystin-dependent protein
VVTTLLVLSHGNRHKRKEEDMATYIKNKATGNWERSGWNGVLSFGFTGCVVPFAGAVEKVPAHWLVCDGSAVGRTEYPDLFDCIGETYGAGDGSTTFNLPDFRECALVGAGENGTDTMEAHDVYDVGEFKNDCEQQATGSFALVNGRDIASGPVTGVFTQKYSSREEGWGNQANNYGGVVHGTVSFDNANVARTGITTHGKQKGVNYIIHV